MWKDDSCFVNGKKVGVIVDGVYITPRNVQEHYYRKQQGYPINVEVLDELVKRGIKLIIIQTYVIDENTHDYLVCDTRQFSVSEYVAAKQFREHEIYGFQKCVPFDRPGPEKETQKTLFSLKEFFYGK